MKPLHVTLVNLCCLNNALADAVKGGRINITRSCSAHDDWVTGYSTHAAVSSSFQVALMWAKEALDQLNTDEDKRGNGNAVLGDHINRLLDNLIGPGARGHTSAKFNKFRNFFENIASCTIYDDAKGQENWVTDLTTYDVEVFCNTDHIYQLPKPIYIDNKLRQWKDTHRNIYFADDDPVIRLHKAVQWPITAPTAIALRFPAKTYPWKYPNNIMLNQRWLTQSRAAHWRFLTKDRIARAADSRLRLRPAGPAQWVPAELLATMEWTALQALAHTDAGGRAVARSFGWLGCLQTRLPDDAETVAWFALAVQLVLHHRHAITRTGLVVGIDPGP